MIEREGVRLPKKIEIWQTSRKKRTYKEKRDYPNFSILSFQS